ncbi:hypothetical protein HYALB_00009063 [Hymenoscyphus albidus]|uniref:Uncharacterized protein n=1 Tax=Hymenoscyphus albidus TaxID=595503 RepID=A0A9N9LRP7_9HELO|nr:hypothetical protein HYALB_00009063 [Hymenoscyphus albidus]
MLLLGIFNVLVLAFTTFVMSNPLGQISLTDAAENDDLTCSSIKKSYQRGVVDIRAYFCCPVPGHSWVEGNEEDIRGIVATYRYYDAGTIADYVEAQLDLCKNVTGAPPECGQIFRKGDGMNIYIQGSCE